MADDAPGESDNPGCVLGGLKTLAGIAGLAAILLALFGGDRTLAVLLGFGATILGGFVWIALRATRD